MTTRELRPWLKEHWPGVRAALDAGTYELRPVRRVMIPKPGGVLRVLDRLSQYSARFVNARFAASDPPRASVWDREKMPDTFSMARFTARGALAVVFGVVGAVWLRG